MAATFKFELVSPERILVSEDADQVILNGTDGQFTVLPGHAPMISTLQPGLMDVTTGGKSRRIYVRGGFAEVEPERLTVLAERAIEADALKGDTLAAERKAAETNLADAKTDEARRLAEAAVASLASLGGAR